MAETSRKAGGRKMKALANRPLLGHVTIENGTLLLVDSSHGASFPTKNVKAPNSGNHLRIDSAGSFPKTAKDKNGAQAVVVGNFGGRGVFPVYAELDGQGLVKQATVDFRNPQAEPEAVKPAKAKNATKLAKTVSIKEKMKTPKAKKAAPAA